MLDPQRVWEYLHGLKVVLRGRLFAIAEQNLEAQISAQWFTDEYNKQPDSAKHGNQQTCCDVSTLHLPKLQLLLRTKLEAERSRNTYLAGIADQERNDVFNETDRIVGNLLDVKVESGTS